jgi:hypothetical protein
MDLDLGRVRCRVFDPELRRVMKRFWLTLGLLAVAIGCAFGQDVSLPIILQPVTSTVPSIDLNFLASTTALPPGVVFSRASSRSCTNSSGVIVTVTTNNPCLDYNPSTLAYIGLSVEAAATNLLVQSSTFTSASWAKSGLTPTITGTAPDGTASANLITEDTTTASHYFYGTTPLFTAGVTYTASGYLKAGTQRYISMRGEAVGASATYPWITLDTQLGTINANGLVTSSIVQALPSGWFRVSLTFVSFSTVNGNIVFSGSNVSTAPGTGAVVGATYTGTSLTWSAWGAQVEQGYAPTSFVATTSSAATRAAEVAYLPVIGIRGVNGSAGTMFAQFIYEAPNPTPNYARFIAFNDGNSPNVGTELGFSNSFSGYPSYISSIVANQASGANGGTSITMSAGSSVRATVSFSSSLLVSAVNTDALSQAGLVPTYIPKSLTVLNISQSQRFQGQASLWVQRVTFIPAFMGAAWVTGKANGSIP